MNILMITSEAEPFAKSGGLADAVSALSRALQRRSHDVRIVMPLFDSVPRKDIRKFCTLSVETGIGIEKATVYSTLLPGSSVPVYFVEHTQYFGRNGMYGSRSEPDYADNPLRFSFFARAAFRLCGHLHFVPDVFHCHDWQGSYAAVFLKHSEPGFKKSKSVLTIHNLGYQGIYSKEHFPYFRLPWELFYGAGFEYYGSINSLKAGISCADILTTVSPTYAKEIQSSEFGCGLDGILRSRSKNLTGILNGVDTSLWNPQTDNYLPECYSINKMDGKATCKAYLQKEFGLEINPNKPLIGMVSRLTSQKGISELFDPQSGAISRICSDMDVQFVVQGSGEQWCEAEIRNLSSRLTNFKSKLGYSEKIAHIIEAGADFFMMPSHYEPCGLNQMYSLNYGTLPIAHKTGGLADTIENFDQETGNGTGFLFDTMSPRSIYDTTGWAVWAYYNHPEFIWAMRTRGMTMPFSWDDSAQEYEKLYKAN